MKASPRSCVPRLGFRSSIGHLEGGDARRRCGARGGGPAALITDVGILTPDVATRELILTTLYASTTVEDARKAFGWPLEVSDRLDVLAEPTDDELATLRALEARTAAAHARPVELPC